MRERVTSAISIIRKTGAAGRNAQFLYTHANDFLKVGADAFADAI